MSRIKIRDLFDRAIRLTRLMNLLQLRWLRFFRTKSQRVESARRRNARVGRDLGSTLDKLRRTGHSEEAIREELRKRSGK